MVRIGGFSKLGRVSIKTLRYDDEMVMLKPIEVDRLPGYRYYEFDQLPRLYRILALKMIGLPMAIYHDKEFRERDREIEVVMAIDQLMMRLLPMDVSRFMTCQGSRRWLALFI